jgi:hypothetical protein
MLTCFHCGANVDAFALACPYCSTRTRYGQEQAERQAAYEYQAAQAKQQREAAARHALQQSIQKKAKNALLLSIGAAFTCCLPAAVVGIIMGLHVKSAAKREGEIAPGTSTAAVVIGGFAVALSCIIVALYIKDARARDARVAVLRAQSDAARVRAAIDQPLACALTELELLEQGYDGHGGIVIEGFRCDGKLETGPDRAILRDVRFVTGTKDNERYVVTACLTRGTRWSVEQIRADGSCSAPSASPSSSAPSR